MDTLTHALVGAAISDSWFRRRLGPVATPFALAAASLPDLDVLTYFVSPEYAWAYHRGYSHSFFIMLLAAPLLGLAGWRIARKAGDWRLWSLLAVLCLFAHTILDLATSWGTMPWLPFSSARVSWDIAPILDAFVFSLAAASFLANRLLRWERVDYFVNPLKYPVVHSHPRRRRAADYVGAIAVSLIAVYLLIGWHQNRQTVRVARDELAKAGVAAVEVRALPILFTYLSWDIVARDGEGTVYNAAFSSYAPEPMRFTAYPTRDSEAIRRVLASPEGRLFAWYAQGMYVAESRSDGDGGGETVTLRDRRFFTLLRPETARFAMDFTLDGSGDVKSAAARQLGFQGVDIEAELRALYQLTRFGRFAPEPAAE